MFFQSLARVESSCPRSLRPVPLPVASSRYLPVQPTNRNNSNNNTNQPPLPHACNEITLRCALPRTPSHVYTWFALRGGPLRFLYSLYIRASLSFAVLLRPAPPRPTNPSINDCNTPRPTSTHPHGSETRPYMQRLALSHLDLSSCT